MTTLLIKDLSVAEALDTRAMSAVRGGTYKGMPAHMLPYFGGVTKNEFSFDASQLIGQTQNIVNNNGNNVAFAHDITSTIKPTQTADNKISF
jgi:hypothetical protein